MPRSIAPKTTFPKPPRTLSARKIAGVAVVSLRSRSSRRFKETHSPRCELTSTAAGHNLAHESGDCILHQFSLSLEDVIMIGLRQFDELLGNAAGRFFGRGGEKFASQQVGNDRVLL